MATLQSVVKTNNNYFVVIYRFVHVHVGAVPVGERVLVAGIRRVLGRSSRGGDHRWIVRCQGLELEWLQSALLTHRSALKMG